MEWVAIDVHIAGDEITHRLAEAFRLRIAEAAGLLTLAFAGMAQHAQDGSLATKTDSQIEEWARWHGKRGAFAAFFRKQLGDEAGQVRAWEKYNGAAIREAKASKERAKKWREDKKREREANAEERRTERRSQRRSGRGLSPVPNGSTGHDRTTSLTTTTLPTSDRVVASLADQTHRVAFHDLLARTPGKETFATRVLILAGQIPSPVPTPVFTWDVIGQAMTDLAQKAAPVNHLLGYCNTIAKRGNTHEPPPEGELSAGSKLFLQLVPAEGAAA